MPLVDTSWLFALLDKLDVHHEKAMRQAHDEERLLVPPEVLAELLQVVHFRIRKASGDLDAHRAARQSLHDLERISTLTLLETAEPTATSRVYKRHPRLSYVDAAAIAAALRSRDGLLSFDDSQKAALIQEKQA